MCRPYRLSLILTTDLKFGVPPLLRNGVWPCETRNILARRMHVGMRHATPLVISRLQPLDSHFTKNSLCWAPPSMCLPSESDQILETVKASHFVSVDDFVCKLIITSVCVCFKGSEHASRKHWSAETEEQKRCTEVRRKASLVPRPSHRPVFDHLQYAKYRFYSMLYSDLYD